MQVPLMIMVEVDDVNDLDSIERGIAQACRRLPSRAMQKITRVVEELAESQDPGRLRRKSMEKRTLWMTCGWAEFERRRYTDVLEEKSYVLFDLRTGLCPRQRMTNAAALMFADLAAISMSYDKTREEVERLWGDGPSTTTIWNHTQRVGEHMRERAKSEREAVFKHGELPGADIPPKDFVAIETDSSMVDAWQKHAELPFEFACGAREVGPSVAV